jgi:hypothetical protein
MLRGMVSPQGGPGLFNSKLEIYNISPSDYQYVTFSRNFVFEEELWLIKILMHAD